MGTGRTSEGHRIWFALLWLLALAALPAHGQTSSAKLAINLNVQSSISLVFNDNPNVGTNGFCPLTNAGTNNVGLDLGSASFTGGDTLDCVGFFRFFNFYEVNSAFDVLVTKSNSNSPNYSLAARISTAPPANVFWAMNLTNLTTTFTTLSTNNNYAQPATQTLRVVVGNAVAPQTLQETITFLATAN
jgi:hypothetical protein